MVASVTAWTFKAGSDDQVRQKNLDIVWPLLQRQPGFVRAYAIHESDGRWVTVMFYDSAEQRDAAMQAISGPMREHLGAIVEGMERHMGEVEYEAGAAER